MKKKLAISIIGLVMSLFIFGTALFAWFTNTDSFNNISFTAGSSSVEVKMYAGADFNYDGYLDKTAEGEDGYTEIDSAVWSAVAMIPTQVYTFKLEVLTSSSVKLGLKLSSSDATLGKYLTVRYSTASAVPTGAFVPVSADSGIDAVTAEMVFQVRLAPLTDDADRAAYQALQASAVKHITLNISAVILD